MDTMSLPEDDLLDGRVLSPILHNEAWYILNTRLTQNRYDPIRDMAGFKAVVDELSQIAK